jgi:hypothetical protein
VPRPRPRLLLLLLPIEETSNEEKEQASRDKASAAIMNSKANDVVIRRQVKAVKFGYVMQYSPDVQSYIDVNDPQKAVI